MPFRAVVAAVAVLACTAFGSGPLSYHPTAVAPYAFENTILRVRFDFDRGIVFGDETTFVRVKRAGLRRLPFHTVGITYSRVRLNGRDVTVTFDPGAELMYVPLPKRSAAGERFTVEFAYRATPTSGVYFIRPDASYPGLTPEIWTQGETTDNRRWFPTWDEPNEKTPSELVLTVPKGWTAIANGYLKSHVRTNANDVWDWNSPRPKSTYLIAFAAGPLVKYHESAGTLDVDSFVQPPAAGLNAICFRRTAAMIRFYERITGVPFPFEKYDHVAAERFTFGGMENSSVTIVTDRALHPAIEDVEASCDLLISHEMAQHWFGDDATMVDWSNGWINEGFATYFDELWTGEHDGEAAFEYARYRAQQTYFSETTRYLRPIVDYHYANALDMFDASGHERPAQVLHMLRALFGDRRFFAALHAYLVQYAYRNAGTHEFFASIEKTLGTNLHWFEDEWFYRASYPHYDVAQTYDAQAQTLTLRVRQHAQDGKLYRMPVSIEVYAAGGVVRAQPTIDRADQTVTVRNIATKPAMVLFDPNGIVLGEVTFPKTVEELAYQLAHAAHVADREWALAQFAALDGAGSETRTRASEAVRDAALEDPFYGLRSDAMPLVARFGDATTLVRGLGDRDVRVRLAAEAAMAGLPDVPAEVMSALEGLTTDADPNVAAAAYASLGALKAPGSYDRLLAALGRPSYGEAIASGALRGLAAYGDPAALSVISARTAYGTPEIERNVAVAALAPLAKTAHQPQAALPVLLHLVASDPLIGTRIAAAKALGLLGDSSALPTLQSVAKNDSQLLVRLAAADAIQHILVEVHATGTPLAFH